MNWSVSTDIYLAAVELSPAHRANLNLQRRKVAAQRLSQCSGLNWSTPEVLCCVPDTAMTCVGGFILFLFIQCLLHKWRRHKGAHPTASRYASHSATVYYKIAGRVHKVWRRKKHAIETRISCLKLWYIVLYYLVWMRYKKKIIHLAIHHFERGKLVYMKVTVSIYHHLPFLRVSAMVIFLWLLMSGDVELNPGPIEGEHHD